MFYSTLVRIDHLFPISDNRFLLSWFERSSEPMWSRIIFVPDWKWDDDDDDDDDARYSYLSVVQIIGRNVRPAVRKFCLLFRCINNFFFCESVHICRRNAHFTVVRGTAAAKTSSHYCTLVPRAHVIHP